MVSTACWSRELEVVFGQLPEALSRSTFDPWPGYLLFFWLYFDDWGIGRRDGRSMRVKVKLNGAGYAMFGDGEKH